MIIVSRIHHATGPGNSGDAIGSLFASWHWTSVVQNVKRLFTGPPNEASRALRKCGSSCFIPFFDRKSGVEIALSVGTTCGHPGSANQREIKGSDLLQAVLWGFYFWLCPRVLMVACMKRRFPLSVISCYAIFTAHMWASEVDIQRS